MKTKEELNEIKEEVETLNKKLHELTDEELAQVSGGIPEGGDTPESNGNPFAGLVEGGVYKANPGGECDYCKIAFINRDNNGVIDYWPGVLQGDHIQRSYPVRYATPGTFRSDFNTELVTNIPWHDF